MAKFTKTHARQLMEYMARMDDNGCVTVDNWTSGKGQHTKNRALPPFVKRFNKGQFKMHIESTQYPSRGTVERVAFDFFRDTKNARRKAVLVLDLAAYYDFVNRACVGQEF